VLKRTLTALVMTAVGLPAIIYGGVFYFLLMGGFLVVGAWEYIRLFRMVKYEPNEMVTVGGVVVLVTTRFFFKEAALPAFAILILLAMAVHLVQYERGRDQAALDMAVTITGLVYVGWMGCYLLDIRNLPQGGWWLMMSLPLVWAADTGGYSIGAVYGKHKLAPRLSPSILCICILHDGRPAAFIRIDRPATRRIVGTRHRRPRTIGRPRREHA